MKLDVTNKQFEIIYSNDFFRHEFDYNIQFVQIFSNFEPILEIYINLLKPSGFFTFHQV